MTEQPGPPRGRQIGHDVYIRMVGQRGLPDDVKVGLIENHPRPDDPARRCEGIVHFDVPANADVDRPKWTVESWEPLTLSPSLLCRECGHHGFIRDGQWVPA